MWRTAWVIGLLLIGAMLAGLGVLPAAAAGLPDNLGPLQDRAGFFTAEQKTQLKQDIAAKQHLRFYILTIASLDGQDGTDYASAVYDHWGLTARDVLLVISQQERQVELSFNNPELQRAVEKGADKAVDGGVSEKTLNGLLQATFVPLARDGDIQRGIQYTIQVLDALGESLSPEAPAGAADGSGSGTAQERTPSEPINWGPFKTFVGNVAKALLYAATAVVLVVAGIWLLRRWRRGAAKLRDIREVREASGRTMVELSQAVERISPLAFMSQGRTARVAQELEQELSELLVAAEAQSKGEPFAHVLQTARLEEQLSRATHELEMLKRAADQVVPAAQELADQERDVPRTVERLRSESKVGLSAYEELTALTEGPVEPVQREFRELDELLVKAEEHAVFDVLTASDWAARAERAMSALASMLQELMDHARYCQAYPELEREARDDVRQVMTEHNLYEREQELYQPLEESRKLAPQLLQTIRRAETIPARSLRQRIDQLFSQAREKAHRLAELQRSNNDKSSILEEALHGLDQFVQHLDQQFFRLSNEYKKSLWQAMETKFLQLKKEYAAALAELERGRERQASQQFAKAKDVFDDLAMGIKQLEKELQACEREILKLDRDKQACLEQFAVDQQSYIELREWIDSGDVLILAEGGLETEYRLVEQTAQQVREAESGWPCDLQHLRKQAALYGEAVAMVREAYTKIRDKKELAVVTLDRYSVLFYRIVDMTTGMFYKMGRKRVFVKLHDGIKELIDRGLYDEALEECKELQRFIDTVAVKAEFANRARRYEYQSKYVGSSSSGTAGATREYVKPEQPRQQAKKPSGGDSPFNWGASSARASSSASWSKSTSSASDSSSSSSSGASSGSSNDSSGSASSSGRASWDSSSSERSSGSASYDGGGKGSGGGKGQSSGRANW